MRNLRSRRDKQRAGPAQSAFPAEVYDAIIKHCHELDQVDFASEASAVVWDRYCADLGALLGRKKAHVHRIIEAELREKLAGEDWSARQEALAAEAEELDRPLRHQRVAALRSACRQLRDLSSQYIFRELRLCDRSFAPMTLQQLEQTLSVVLHLHRFALRICVDAYSSSMALKSSISQYRLLATLHLPLPCSFAA